eukprot:jgi/Orpsp1_1/1187895/evm.model.d7180000061002.1
MNIIDNSNKLYTVSLNNNSSLPSPPYYYSKSLVDIKYIDQCEITNMNSFVYNSDSSSKNGIKDIPSTDKKILPTKIYSNNINMNNITTISLNSPSESASTVNNYNVFPGSNDSYSTTSTENSVTPFNNDVLSVRPYPSPCINYTSLKDVKHSNDITMTPLSATSTSFKSVINPSNSNSSINLNTGMNSHSSSFQSTYNSTYNSINTNNNVGINTLTNNTVSGASINTLSNISPGLNNINLNINMNQVTNTSPIIQTQVSLNTSNQEPPSYQTTYSTENTSYQTTYSNENTSYQTTYSNENIINTPSTYINECPVTNNKYISLNSNFTTQTNLPMETTLPSTSLTNYSNQIQPLFSNSSSSSPYSSTSSSSSSSSSTPNYLTEKRKLNIIIPSNQTTNSTVMNTISPIILTPTTDNHNQLVSPIYTTPTENISYVTELNNPVIKNDEYVITNNNLAESSFVSTPPPFNRTVTKSNSDPLMYCLINNTFSDFEKSFYEE